MKKIQKQDSIKYIYEAHEIRDVSAKCAELESYLKKWQRPFTRQSTTYTKKYQYGKKTVEFVPVMNFGNGGIKFIRAVKEHFAKLPLPERISSDRPYYEYFRPISTYTEISNCAEVDINKAYWQSAYDLGYLSREFFDMALSDNVPKKARLIALGILGKKTEIYTSDGKEGRSEDNYEKTRVFWDNIVWQTGEVMREVVTAYKTHIFGMWFDAIFCDASAAAPIRSWFHRRGYGVKILPVSSYIVTPRPGIVPGAKIKRIFRNGEVKEMDISYIPENTDKMTMEQFLSLMG